MTLGTFMSTSWIPGGVISFQFHKADYLREIGQMGDDIELAHVGLKTALGPFENSSGVTK